MSINLVTYANQTVTPTNDAIIYERAIDQNGIFYGCNVTVTSNTVNITGGYGIICGREFVINSDSLTVTLAPSGTLQGRLYVRLDLADADAPIQLLTATGNTLPALTQDDDVNYTNGVYEMELATFTVGVSALSDVVETFETIIGTKNKISNSLPTVTNITNIAANVTVLRGGYFQIGNLIVISMVFRVSTNTFNADSLLVGVPPAYQADAPLSIFKPSASPNALSSTCRIAGGYIRPGLTLTASTEYTICGTYFASN